MSTSAIRFHGQRPAVLPTSADTLRHPHKRDLSPVANVAYFVTAFALVLAVACLNISLGNDLVLAVALTTLPGILTIALRVYLFNRHAANRQKVRLVPQQ